MHSYIFGFRNPNLPILKIIYLDIYYSKKNWTPIHSYIFQFIRIFSPPKKSEPQFIRISSNSFVYLPKKSEPQFIRISSNSFVYLRISKPSSSNTKYKINIYYSKKTDPQFIRISSNSFVFSRPKKNWTTIHWSGISSNSFVYLPQKNLNPNSFVYLPIQSYIFRFHNPNPPILKIK